MTWRPALVKKSLLTPTEKQAIVEAIRADATKDARFWSARFRRLPATITRIATEAGLELSK